MPTAYGFPRRIPNGPSLIVPVWPGTFEQNAKLFSGDTAVTRTRTTHIAYVLRACVSHSLWPALRRLIHL